MLEKLEFQRLVEEKLTIRRLRPAMPVYQFAPAMVLALYVGFVRLNHLRFFGAGALFGYYTYPSSTIIYHLSVGYEGIVDAPAGGADMYDFLSGNWLYTRATLFPYLYDYTRNIWLYYFPDTNNPAYYTANPRFFADIGTGMIFTT